MGNSMIRTSPKAGEYAQAERVTPRPARFGGEAPPPGYVDPTTATGPMVGGGPESHVTGAVVNTPIVRPGEMVLFYPDANANTTPHNAFVAAVEGPTLVLDVMMASGMMKKRGVRWMGDPRAASINMRKHGGWGLARTMLHERVEKLEGDIATALAHIEGMADAIEALQNEIKGMKMRAAANRPNPPKAPAAQ